MVESDNRFLLKGTIKGFDGKLAIIETADKLSLPWPIKNLPDEIKEGSAVKIEIFSERTEGEAQEKIAKAVLNNLLSG